MGNKHRPKTNAEMCEIVTLRRKTREQGDRIKELEKTLSRSMREIETLSAQYSDTGSKYLVEKIKKVLSDESI